MPDRYITREELRLAPYNLDEYDEDNKVMESLQDLTRELVDELCVQSFDADGTEGEPTEVKVDGTGHDTLWLPKRLASLDKIRVYSSATAYTEYEATDFVAEAKYISWLSFVDPSLRLSTGYFPKGVRNIGVLGIWGFIEVPKPILYLQGRLIQRVVDTGELVKTKYTERMGDYTYTTKELTDYILDDPELEMIVQMYSVPMDISMSG